MHTVLPFKHLFTWCRSTEVNYSALPRRVKDVGQYQEVTRSSKETVKRPRTRSQNINRRRRRYETGSNSFLSHYKFEVPRRVNIKT